MRLTSIKRWATIALAGLGALTMAPVQAAADFPTQPIRLVLSYPPGGVMDPVARLMAPHLSQELGQPVVVENRPGASGTIGAAYASRATPDGHTILFAPNGVSLHPVTMKSFAGYDVRTDLESVSLVASGPYLLVANANFPVNTVEELVEYVKQNPDKVFYGTAGTASPLHLLTEMFNHSAGIHMTHVPYQGNGPVVKALLSGEIQVGFDTIPGAKALVEAGRLKVLAVTTKKRNTSMPDVPTLEESGIKNVSAELWQGFFLPKGTPEPIIQRWNEAILKVLQVPEVKERMNGFGFDIEGSTPQALADRIDHEVGQWEAVVKRANIALQ